MRSVEFAIVFSTLGISKTFTIVDQSPMSDSLADDDVEMLHSNF